MINHKEKGVYMAFTKKINLYISGNTKLIYNTYLYKTLELARSLTNQRIIYIIKAYLNNVFLFAEQ
jgi:hypothetical protein